MEGINSFEQRSTSRHDNEDYDQLFKQNRIIVVNRYEPEVIWSANNLPFKSIKFVAFSWFSNLIFNCYKFLLCKRKIAHKFKKRLNTTNAKTNITPTISTNTTTSPSSPSILNDFNSNENENDHDDDDDNDNDDSEHDNNNNNSFDSGPFPSNELTTSKYTIFNFLPKNLFEQFKRLANFYFLISAILQCILPFSPVGPTTSLLPLIFVISTTAIKQAYEDYLRHKMDNEVNNRQCHVLRDKKLLKICSKDIKVGDFVYVKNNEEIPCDMMLLATSGIHGDRCYVTTANLDGETNLKSRSCVNIKEQLGNIEQLDEQLLIIECDKPNATLYEFNGFLRAPKDFKTYEKLISNLITTNKLSKKINLPSSSTTTTTKKEQEINGGGRRSSIFASTINTTISSIETSSGIKTKAVIRTIVNRIKQANNRINLMKSFKNLNNNKQNNTIDENNNKNLVLTINNNNSNLLSSYHEIPLDITNLLLRASRLRNTSYIYGLALYTGYDTKLCKNSHVKANKFSSTENKVNIYLAIAFAILILFSLIGALSYKSYNYWYLNGLIRADSFEQIFIAHFLLYNYIIPISLYVTLEFVKFFGTMSVVNDKKMRTSMLVSVNQTADSAIDSKGANSNSSLSKTSASTIYNSNSIKTISNKLIKSNDIDGLKVTKSNLDNNINMLMSKSLISLKSSPSIGGSKKVRVIEKPKCNSSDLNEELGLIEVLFSDKTGTLTENKMRFTACSTNGNLYRFIKDQLYLQPKDLFNETVYDITEKLAKYKTNRHAHLNNTNRLPIIKINNRQNNNNDDDNDNDNGCDEGVKRKRIRKINNKNIDINKRLSPFNHRKIPPFNRLKLIDDLSQQENIVEFFLCLCLCSTITLNETNELIDCLPERAQGEYDFQTASPDEESLISAAHLCGVTMCKSNDRECFIVIDRVTSSTSSLSLNFNEQTNQNENNQLQQQQHQLKEVSDKKDNKCDNNNNNNNHSTFKALIETKNSNKNYIVRHFERLMTFEFNSNRKRMSVIYRDCDNNCLIMVSKGSEELLDCINLNNLNDLEKLNINLTMSHFEAFAKSGLRTLLVARKILTLNEFESISNEMKNARLSLKNRDLLLNNLYKLNENNLKLIGSTAVEDTLQEGVPETIENLKLAGIKVWLLTGDKVETAISVAYLCKLLTHEMKLFYMVRLQDSKACKRILNSFKRQLIKESILPINNTDNDDNIQQDSYAILKKNPFFVYHHQNENKHKKFALIADGRSLYYAMKYHRKEFAKLCKQCQVVLGCRLSPLQKAEVVDMIKQDKGKPVTAAIGDGANDVSMIQEAHVGIGVRGKEGRQAVNCSDFAINRFYMLNRLFFVHGHLFYHRTATTIQYFFYKNLLFVLPQFLYSFYNLSSAQSLYHPILLICYNLIFTSLPILLYGLYEIHIPELILENYPILYKLNKFNYLMRMSTFFNWLLLALLEGFISFYILFFIWGSHTAFLENGKMADFNAFGLKIYFIIIITGILKLYFLSKNHTIYFNLSTLISILLLPILFYLYSLIDFALIFEDNSLYGQFEIYLKSPTFWLAIISTTMATIIPEIVLYLKDRAEYYRIITSVLTNNSSPSTLPS